VTPITNPDSPRAPSASAARSATRTPTLLVVGNDALLAARPATAVQFAHAGLRAGFDVVVPGSWGDELVAAACARHLAAGRRTPAVFCACPHVAQRLLGVGAELAPFLASFVAPPTALARFLRRLYEPGTVRLTYVGRCPGAFGDAYDAVVSPEEFLRLLADREIVPAAQADAFEALVPPDRRRYHSLPGGLPAVTSLRTAGAPHAVVELMGDDLAGEIAQHLLNGLPALVDASARLGCACAGATLGAAPEASDDPRAAVAAMEPPRALAPVVELPTDAFDLTLPLPAASRDTTDLIAALTRQALAILEGAEPHAETGPPMPTEQVVERLVAVEHDGPPRRRSPAGGVPVVRPPAGFTPIARGNDGRVLPRAYVARRRSGPRPAMPDDGSAADR
jgi:hypothetical protein